MSKYETEIHGSWLEDKVHADIKYPCGEVVASWSCETFVEAGRLVTEWLKANPFVRHHGCTCQYCG